MREKTGYRSTGGYVTAQILIDFLINNCSDLNKTQIYIGTEKQKSVLDHIEVKKDVITVNSYSLRKKYD